MNKTITFQIEEIPTTCFECPFASKWYCYADCPFINSTREDTELTPKNCPLKDKNKNKIYTFDKRIFTKHLL